MIAQRVGLIYPATSKALHMIRTSTVATTPETDELLNSEIEMSGNFIYKHCKGKRGRVDFEQSTRLQGSHEKSFIKGLMAKDVIAESLLNNSINQGRRDSNAYIGRYNGYEALKFCAYLQLRVDHWKRFSRGKIYVNRLKSFRSYTKKKIAKFHGISMNMLPLSLPK